MDHEAGFEREFWELQEFIDLISLDGPHRLRQLVEGSSPISS